MSLLNYFRPSRAPHLRDAVTGDAEILARLHAESFRQGWDAAEFERLIAERAVRAHVLTEGPRRAPVAFVISHVVPPEAEILSIAVARGRRGQGYGRRLLEHHLARLAAERVTTSHLEVEEGNAPALSLYKRLGYMVAGRRKGYYAKETGAVDALILRRDF